MMMLRVQQAVKGTRGSRGSRPREERDPPPTTAPTVLEIFLNYIRAFKQLRHSDDKMEGDALYRKIALRNIPKYSSFR